MKRVGIREFKDRITVLLGSRETLVIERHGTPVGFYVPVEAKDREGRIDSLARLSVTVDEVLSESGLSEEELVHEMTDGGHRLAPRP